MSEHLERIGQQIGDYRLLRWLGRGSSGSVYLAEQRDEAMPVALKLLQARPARKNEMRAFVNEARTIRLTHPHILPVLDFGINHDGIPYLVMEYVPLGTLRDHFPRGTQVPLPLVIRYTKQVAAALHYAHIHHLIHRDVKPENMLLRDESTVLLSDFGIVATLHSSRSLSLDQQMIGTPLYMAPEQLHGRPLATSDQYSLGVVVYEWLSGRRLFDGTLIEIAMRHDTMLPPSLSAYVSGLPDAVERVVFKALEKEPGKRFESVMVFAEALEQASSLSLPWSANSAPPAAPIPALSQPIQTAGPAMFVDQSLLLAPPLEQRDISRHVSPVVPIPAVRHAQDGSASLFAPGSTSSHPSGMLSRRNALIIIGAVGLGLGGTGLLWLAVSQLQDTPKKNIAPTPPPVPIGLGKVLTAYHGHTALVNVVAWSPDSQHIASGSDDRTIQVWEAATGKLVVTYQGHQGLVEAVAWSPDGKLIASGGFDATVQIWDAATGEHRLTYSGHTQVVDGLAWSPDGKRLASASYDQTVQIWDAATGKSQLTYREHVHLVRAVAWSPDGKHLASASEDQTVRVWDAQSGSTIFIYRGHIPSTTNIIAAVNTVAWSPDGKRIASGGNDQTVQVWDAQDYGKYPMIYRGHVGVVDTLAWSPDGQRIASGGDDNTVQVWNALDGTPLFTFQKHAAEVRTVAWSPDGRLIASGGTDKIVQVWGAE